MSFPPSSMPALECPSTGGLEYVPGGGGWIHRYPRPHSPSPSSPSSSEASDDSCVRLEVVLADSEDDTDGSVSLRQLQNYASDVIVDERHASPSAADWAPRRQEPSTRQILASLSQQQLHAYTVRTAQRSASQRAAALEEKENAHPNLSPPSSAPALPKPSRLRKTVQLRPERDARPHSWLETLFLEGADDDDNNLDDGDDVDVDGVQSAPYLRADAEVVLSPLPWSDADGVQGPHELHGGASPPSQYGVLQFVSSSLPEEIDEYPSRHLENDDGKESHAQVDEHGQALHAPGRSAAALGHELRARLSLDRHVHDECELTVEQVCALLAIIMKKYKIPRRGEDEIVLVIRFLMPSHHNFPANIWRVLRCSHSYSGRGLQHTEVRFCAQEGIMPKAAGRSRKDALCDKPMVYYGQDALKTNCSNCTHTATRTSFIIPIKRHIQNLWSRTDLQRFLQKSFKSYSGPKAVQEDVVDSKAFKKYCGDFVSGEGYRNIVLMLYADGVSVATRRDSSMFVITAQVVNLPPDQRRLLDNMLLLQIIPGPRTPSNISGLLQPLVDELQELFDVGFDITVGDGAAQETFNIRAMLITIVADCRAHPKLTMMKQTPAVYPCHLCELKGVSGRHLDPQQHDGAAEPEEEVREVSAPAPEEERKAQADEARAAVDAALFWFLPTTAPPTSPLSAAVPPPSIIDDGAEDSDDDHRDDDGGVEEGGAHEEGADSGDDDDGDDDDGDDAGQRPGRGAVVHEGRGFRYTGMTYSHQPLLNQAAGPDAGCEPFRRRQDEEIRAIAQQHRDLAARRQARDELIAARAAEIRREPNPRKRRKLDKVPPVSPPMSLDEEKGVSDVGLSVFLQLPYFCMPMVQYDLMHTATGVLSTYFKAFYTAGHPWRLTQTQRENLELHFRKVQKPNAGYLHPLYKFMTQPKHSRASEKLKYARAGHLTYLVRHLQPARRGQNPAAMDAWAKTNDQLLALHWMCTYIDALCVPVIDQAQLHRIRALCKRASWYWYQCLPVSMHTLLAHAMLHMAEQAALFGPQPIFWLFHMERYIGFLTRCALSKPHPELSIVNTVNALALATGRVPPELAKLVFGDAGAADHLAYSGTPTARPRNLHELPWRALPKRPRTDEAKRRLRTEQRQANRACRAALLEPWRRARIQAILQAEDDDWNVDDPSFNTAVCLHGVVRDTNHEKAWDHQLDGFVDADSAYVVNRHIFACACNSRTGVSVEATIHPKYRRRGRIEAPASIACTQRAPFEEDDDIAYGLVTQWIVAVQDGSTMSAEPLITMIARVRIFVWEPEKGTGWPMITQLSPPPYDEHYMLAKHITCRITLSPRPPRDQQHYLVSHVL